MQHAYFLGEGVAFVLQEVLDQLYREFGVYDASGQWPTFRDLLLHMLKTRPVKGREAAWMESALRAVGVLCFGAMDWVLNLVTAPSSKLALLNLSFFAVLAIWAQCYCQGYPSLKFDRTLERKRKQMELKFRKLEFRPITFNNYQSFKMPAPLEPTLVGLSTDLDSFQTNISSRMINLKTQVQTQAVNQMTSEGYIAVRPEGDVIFSLTTAGLVWSFSYFEQSVAGIANSYNFSRGLPPLQSAGVGTAVIGNNLSAGPCSTDIPGNPAYGWKVCPSNKSTQILRHQDVIRMGRKRNHIVGRRFSRFLRDT